MSNIKTKQHNADVSGFINDFVQTEQKRQDAFQLLNFMEEITGHEPKMWGSSIIGFGKYHYKSEKSRQEGDWPLVGFSPRKTAISLYIYSGGADQQEMLKELGNFKMGKGCIYIKKLADINQETLKKIILSTINYLQSK